LPTAGAFLGAIFDEQYKRHTDVGYGSKADIWDTCRIANIYRHSPWERAGRSVTSLRIFVLLADYVGKTQPNKTPNYGNHAAKSCLIISYQ
jgi:hypothetical protein